MIRHIKSAQELAMAKKCLILGGGGFIGAEISDQLLAAGWSIRIFDRFGAAPYRTFSNSESVEWVQGDFGKYEKYFELLAGVDVVIHLISTTLPKDSNEFPQKDVTGNIISTLHLLDAMVKSGVKKIVFASSGGTVYGRPKFIPITESHPTNPEVSYGITKLAIEKYLYLYDRLHEINSIVLRIANPYGGRQRIESAQGAIAAFLHRAVRKLSIDIWGDGEVTRDYLHVSDVAKAFALAVEYTGSEKVFNIGSGIGVSLNELLKMIQPLVEYKLTIHYSPGRSFDVPVSILSNKLAYKELGWAPVVSLDQGLKKTFAEIATLRDTSFTL